MTAARRIEREEDDLVALLTELRRWGGFAGTPDLAERTEISPRRAREALKLGELCGFVTSKRGGGMTYGRPLWWTLTPAGREMVR